MNILITGVAGFIGYNLARSILKNNIKINIIGLDNINNYYSIVLKKKRLQNLKKYKNFSFYKLNLENKKKVDLIFLKNKFDIVIHLAAQAGVKYSIENPRKYLDSNILGFFNILENCKKYKPKKIFYASSSSVYGDSSTFPLNENQNINPVNFYGMTKKNNEEMSQLYSDYYNLRLIGLRFFTVYGEWGRPDMVVFKILESAFKGKLFKLFNNGNHFRDFTYIDDVTDIIQRLIKYRFKNKHTILNICSSKPIKLTFLLKLCKKNNLKVNLSRVGFQKADIIKTHGENKLIKKFTKKNDFVDFEVGFKKCIEWYKKFILNKK